MPQRTEYIVLSDIKATDTIFDDNFEADIEGQANLLSFTVNGATAAFLATAPAEGGIAHNYVNGVVIPIADAASTGVTAAINGLLDEVAGIDAVVTSFNVDGGNYEQFQNITTPFRAVVGTERMLVTAVVDGATEDTWTVIRGIDGTTAAAHVDGAAFTHYVGPEATFIGVSDASLFAVNDVLKIATGGVERLLVTAKDETADTLTVQRGLWGTTVPAVIADASALWDVIDDVKVIAAVAAANANLRLLGNANKYPEGDTRDNAVPLLAADYA
jgi:hypothetical protein